MPSENLASTTVNDGIDLDQLCFKQNCFNDDSTWFFGYGSLIWKVDFPYLCKHPGYIKGFNRRFYQNSVDHRGTPSKPGRVVTLIPSAEKEAKVYGIAYKISDKNKENVIRHLDFREINGYEKVTVNFHPVDSIGQSLLTKPKEIVLYLASNDNPSFAGETDDLNTIADQIWTSVGKSGPNRDYVYRLATAMRTFFPDVNDSHLFSLEKLLLQREEKLKSDVTVNGSS